MTAEERKQQPVATGVYAYFPKALKYIAKVSLAGNLQHHPDKPLHWDKSKSTDDIDAGERHLLDHLEGNILDTDGILHIGKHGWRALASLERFLDAHPEYLVKEAKNEGKITP